MKLFPFIILVVAIMAGCHQRNSTTGRAPARDTAGQTENHDSLKQLSLLKAVYQWHDKNQSRADFQVVVKDSFQTGLNYDSFRIALAALTQTNYFSSSFIENYKGLADYVNNKLANAHPKYLNEINFSFQDADPWTGFQEEAPDYWDRFKITDYKSVPDSASLNWTISDSATTSDKYGVRFEKENGQWKVSYLQGFDRNKL
jgi:hypothetical protein